MQEITLNNQVTVPQLGLGVFQIEDDNILKDAVKAAIKDGYRHFDTATLYKNEQALGEALADSGVPRDELFVTSKVWNTVTTYDDTIAAFKESLRKLNMDYLDLYLIHWPTEGYLEKWRALEDLYDQGLVRAIGVSNFEKEDLEQLLAHAKVTPAVDQVETHPYYQRPKLHALLKQLGIAYEAWSPLGRAKNGALQDPTLQKIAKTHNKSVAQVIIRWHIQNDEIVIPKSTHANRIEENFNVFDFSLTDSEMKQIAGLDKNESMN
ncbi:aldo/keto reductase [Ligilactobacillus pobuzihii]|uniref:aldo/keto reductase n=1 Tax=Ligilactobacillus pobuzihii TaxID=449659 RepID=UPI0019D11A68|nr:aldo/keto reductase [Ligilactobacillus pobuzihii]MBN7274546.1 aldo/keto reductase [Ligilactobacillus pobuzihii]